ncbi:MAG: TerB family tellurite resistance protein [Cyanobacteriota bacterium]|nr:TerB family tellurite resistance protein [Cyanobacteriota bacterium]
MTSASPASGNQPPVDPIGQLSGGQRALLRLVCWVAMADGDFAEEERRLLERLVERLVPQQSGAAEEAVHALAAEALQRSDPQALVAQLSDDDERQLAVKLAYQMACSNQRPQDASQINSAEKVAYRRLVELLNLPENEVAEAEWAAAEELKQKRSLLDVIGSALAGFGAWPAFDARAGDLPPGYWL